ncbi:Hypothetical predicted protein [Paramuricea clavata]|uniref:Uncharacterized protein n=2 Tax=Paramuricea clavata TaxID=317549 RepID=A0A6S7HU43_PARCT|nr:Hypothetical predicted protein [Paramuricea clavata]
MKCCIYKFPPGTNAKCRRTDDDIRLLPRMWKQMEVLLMTSSLSPDQDSTTQKKFLEFSEQTLL